MEATNQGLQSRVFCRKRRNKNNVEANHGHENGSYYSGLRVSGCW